MTTDQRCGKCGSTFLSVERLPRAEGGKTVACLTCGWRGYDAVEPVKPPSTPWPIVGADWREQGYIDVETIAKKTGVHRETVLRRLRERPGIPRKLCGHTGTNRLTPVVHRDDVALVGLDATQWTAREPKRRDRLVKVS